MGHRGRIGSGARSVLVATSLLFIAGTSCNRARLSPGDVETPTPASSGTPEATPTPAGGGPIWFPQAINGAMWANPDLFPTLPLRIAVLPAAGVTAVSVSLEGNVVNATGPDANGVYTAQLPIAGHADGTVTLTATGTTATGAVTVDAHLGIGKQGVQVTSIATTGRATTPRLHRVGNDAWLTWTDFSATVSQAYLSRIDGMGHFVGSKIPLIANSSGASGVPTNYIRTAFGGTTVGVLYQQMPDPSQPYMNRFEVVDLTGHVVVAPIDLDPAGTYGSWGGDVDFDGTGYVAAFRDNDGAGHSNVRWVRVDASTGAVTGPVVVASPGNDDPNGGFDPITTVTVRALGDTSLVGFERGYWNATAAFSVPKSQFARVSDQGAVSSVVFGGSATDELWHHEDRVFVVGGQFVPLWSTSDLLDPNPNPPYLFHGATTGAGGPLQGAQVMVNSPEQRDDPFLLGHPEKYGVLAWCDQRTYVNQSTGKIELYFASVDADLSTHGETKIPHAKFIDGTDELNGALAGTNVVLIWLDERHGGGIADPKPEIYLETLWY